MKKLISIILTVMLALSVSITAFAAEREATPDTSDFEYQVKEAIFKQFFESRDGFDVTIDDIYFLRSATLSDGRFYFSFLAGGVIYPGVSYEKTIGDYYYSYSAGLEVYLYNDGEIIEIDDAYEAGIINDDILAELSAFGYFGIEPMNDVPVPTESEPVTQPQTENTEATKESATQPQLDNTDATSATKAVPSNSISTIDTPSSVKSNGTVQTGQSNFAILTLLIVMALAGAAAVFSKYAYRK